MDTKGGSRGGWCGGGGMNWEIGIDIYTLICIKQITNIEHGTSLLMSKSLLAGLSNRRKTSNLSNKKVRL